MAETSSMARPPEDNSGNSTSGIPWHPDWETRPTKACFTTSTKGANNIHYDTGDEFCITDYWVSDGKTSRDHFFCTATLNGKDCGSCVYFDMMNYCPGGGVGDAEGKFQLDCQAAKQSYSQVDVCGDSVRIWKSSAASADTSGLGGLFGLLFGVFILAVRIAIRSEMAQSHRRGQDPGYNECNTMDNNASEIEILGVPDDEKGIATTKAHVPSPGIV